MEGRPSSGSGRVHAVPGSVKPGALRGDKKAIQVIVCNDSNQVLYSFCSARKYFVNENRLATLIDCQLVWCEFREDMEAGRGRKNDSKGLYSKLLHFE